MRPGILGVSLALGLIAFGGGSPGAEPPPEPHFKLVLQTPPAASVTSVAVSPDGSLVATAANEGGVRLHDARTGALIRALGEAGDRSVTFSPDGHSVAAGGFHMDKRVGIYDVRTGRRLRTLAGHTEWETDACTFSPDGTRIATAGSDFRGRIWDAKTGKESALLKGHASFLNGIAFSPDGTRVATAGADNTARVWDAATGELLFTLIGHTDDVRTISFNVDGTRLLTASDDKTAKLWDAKVGNETLTLAGHGDRVTAAAFGQRRKMLRASLKTLVPRPEELLEAAGLSPELRAERLTVRDFAKLAYIYERSNAGR